MNVQEFCQEYSTKELQEIKKGIEDLESVILGKYVNPDNLNVMLSALHDNTIEEMDSGILELAITCLCNKFNKELIEKELFRRQFLEEDKELTNITIKKDNNKDNNNE
jgi:hypothetical protein